MGKLAAARRALRRGGVPELTVQVRRQLARRIDVRPAPAPAVATPKKAKARPAERAINDSYVTLAPSGQNAVDIFRGQWASALPAELGLEAGAIRLFSDSRISWAIEQFGGMKDQRVLELGPLEGGHSHMLAAAGADVLAVESNTGAYLRCLVAKELTGRDSVRFVLGDFMEYLRSCQDHFDVCIASGVLYHMRDPLETLALTAGVAQKLFLWTHYYDAEVLAARSDTARRFGAATTGEFNGFAHTLHRQSYGTALNLPGFCGGDAPYSNWLSRDDLLRGLAHVGWQVDAIAFEDPQHPNGPALALTATRMPAGA
ncbi:MAG TPA: DUF1698 domain-containing protein [Sporichthyaceae bacterium]|nr:DUF1698 domain-containing protein [Sporichthyaceae bacterium]